MKKLSVLPATLAVAIGSLAAPACSPKITGTREDTNGAVTTTTAQTRNLSYHDIERLLKSAQQEEQI